MSPNALAELSCNGATNSLNPFRGIWFLVRAQAQLFRYYSFRSHDIAVLFSFLFHFFFLHNLVVVSFLLVLSNFYRELPMEHQRRIIGYQDLDAPQYDLETSMFSWSEKRKAIKQITFNSNNSIYILGENVLRIWIFFRSLYLSLLFLLKNHALIHLPFSFLFHSKA